MKHFFTLAVICCTLVAANSAQASAQYRWPSAVRQVVITSCMESQTGSYCVCALRWMERRYSWSRMSFIYYHRPELLAKIIDRARYACSA